MHLSSSVIWIGIAVLGFVVYHAFVAKPRDLGAMSGQWMAEHRAATGGSGALRMHGRAVVVSQGRLAGRVHVCNTCV
jgi:hypothetical protein